SDVAAVGPAKRLESLSERAQVGLIHRKALDDAHQYANPRYPICLLRARRERPRRRRTAEKRDERASLHSITSSPRPGKVGGMSRLSALAVLRLITNSNFTVCCTGRSAGFSPLRIRPA